MAGLKFPPDEGPYAYRRGRGFLYRTPGGIKLLGFLLFSLAPFFFGLRGLLVLALLLAVAAASAGFRPWQLLRGSRPLFITVLAALGFRSLRFAPPFFSLQGFMEGLPFALRVALSFAAGALLFRVTTMTELREALGKRRLSLALALMLGFIPRFFDIWETLSVAYEARCGRGGLRRIVALVPPLAERMLEAAAETACALESRGLLGMGGGGPRPPHTL